MVQYSTIATFSSELIGISDEFTIVSNIHSELQVSSQFALSSLQLSILHIPCKHPYGGHLLTGVSSSECCVTKHRLLYPHWTHIQAASDFIHSSFSNDMHLYPDMTTSHGIQK